MPVWEHNPGLMSPLYYLFHKSLPDQTPCQTTCTLLSFHFKVQIVTPSETLWGCFVVQIKTGKRWYSDTHLHFLILSVMMCASPNETHLLSASMILLYLLRSGAVTPCCQFKQKNLWSYFPSCSFLYMHHIDEWWYDMLFQHLIPFSTKISRSTQAFQTRANSLKLV